MIRSKITKTNIDKDITYPCLMCSDSDAVVLFYKFGHGICVGGTSHGIGDYSYGWDMENFTEFTGRVVLTAE